MSHNWNCPTDSQARLRGERDFERGKRTRDNPYADEFRPRYSYLDDPYCEDASRSWKRGYEAAQEREDQERREREE